jgi:hypothetical protein
MWKVGTFKVVAPLVLVKDRWVGPREQVLNIPIESASRPPCEFWRIDDQQLEI